MRQPSGALGGRDVGNGNRDVALPSNDLFLAERELSQLAAGGMTRDGGDDFDAGLSGDMLRIGTIRAPGPAAKTRPKAVWGGRTRVMLDCICERDLCAVEKRQGAAAVQDAGALTDDPRMARSVVECASPLALWAGGVWPSPAAAMSSRRRAFANPRPDGFTTLLRPGTGALRAV